MSLTITTDAGSGEQWVGIGDLAAGEYEYRLVHSTPEGSAQATDVPMISLLGPSETLEQHE